MKIRRLATLALLLAAPLPGCDQVAAQETFDLAARAAPSGYTEMSASGEVVRRDPDDWRVSPAFATRISIAPAFPNPATSGSLVRVGVTIFEFDGAPNGLVLYRRTADGVLVRLDSRTTSGPGAYELSAPGSLIGSGLVRLVVADAFGLTVTYGDVQVR
ncbi:MAG: hypothetical protein IAE99_10035 [Rhodothermales bacterium]|nr:hypothetical protein [Rhodothermales bacterium]MCA0269314.1 hypothetical protein [Bacteroidota bacterium]